MQETGERSKTLNNLLDFYNKNKPFSIENPNYHIPLVALVVTKLSPYLNNHYMTCMNLDDFTTIGLQAVYDVYNNTRTCRFSSKPVTAKRDKGGREFNTNHKQIGGYLYRTIYNRILAAIRREGGSVKLPPAISFTQIREFYNRKICVDGNIKRDKEDIDNHFIIDREMSKIYSKRSNSIPYTKRISDKITLEKIKQVLNPFETEVLNLRMQGFNFRDIGKVVGLSNERTRFYVNLVIEKCQDAYKGIEKQYPKIPQKLIDRCIERKKRKQGVI